MIGIQTPPHGGAFDWNIAAVVPAPGAYDGAQYVILACGCVGVWAALERGAPAALIGYGRMCYAHECFKLLARVWMSPN